MVRGTADLTPFPEFFKFSCSVERKGREETCAASSGVRCHVHRNKIGTLRERARLV